MLHMGVMNIAVVIPQTKRSPLIDGKADPKTNPHRIARVDGPAIFVAHLSLDIPQITEAPINHRRIAGIHHTDRRLYRPEPRSCGLFGKHKAQIFAILISKLTPFDLVGMLAGVTFYSQTPGKIGWPLHVKLKLERAFHIAQAIAGGVINNVHRRAVKSLALPNSLFRIDIGHPNTHLEPVIEGITQGQRTDKGISLHLTDVDQTYHESRNNRI